MEQSKNFLQRSADDQQITANAVEAAGYRVKHSEFDDAGNFDFIMCKKVTDTRTEWAGFAPLKNNGDAFRLMVEAKVNVEFDLNFRIVEACLANSKLKEKKTVRVDYESGQEEDAARRAIVVALARESTAENEKPTGE